MNASAFFSVPMLRCLFLLWCWLAPLSALAQQSAPPVEMLTLEQAITLALRDNPATQRATLEVSKNADQLAAARTRLRPAFDVNLLVSQPLTRLDFAFAKGVFGNYPNVGPLPAQDTTIGTPRQPTTFLVGRIAQPLSQLPRLKLGLQLTALGGALARERLRGEQQLLVRQLRRAYGELLSWQSVLAAEEENIRLYRELDRLVTQYVAERVVLRAEALDAKVQLAAAELNALKARNALVTQREQLNVWLGRAPETPWQAVALPETDLSELEPVAATTRALEQRPDVRAARLQVQQAELEQRIKRAQRYPDVSLAFTYLRIAPVSIIPANIASLGLEVTWEPFDWGRRKHELAEQQKTLTQAQLTQRTLEAQAQLEINALARQWQEARAALRVAQLMQESAREKLRVATTRFSEQAALLKEVLQAQAATAAAQQQYQTALLAHWHLRAELARAVGADN